MQILETERLTLTELTAAHAPFMLRLLNDPGWLRFIGDRGVRTVKEAKIYLENGPISGYRKHGYGIWLVTRKADNTFIGICGILKRDTLPDPDIGFAFLPEFGGQGFAYEAAQASLNFGRKRLGMPRIAAITNPENERSIKLLLKLGLQFEKTVLMPGDTQECNFFAVEFTGLA